MNPEACSEAAEVASLGDEKSAWAFVLPWPIEPPGGINTVVRNLIEHMARSNVYTPLLIELLDSAAVAPLNATTDRIRNLGVRPPSIRANRFRSGLAFLATLPVVAHRIRRLRKSRRITVFNFHNPTLHAFVFVLMRRVGLLKSKIVLSAHGLDARLAVSDTGLNRALIRWIYENSDLVVTPSEALKGTIENFAPRARTRVIHNGVDPERLLAHSSTNTSSHQRRLKDQSQVVCIVSVSGYEHNKGLDVLLNAFPLILKEVPNASLKIAGRDGPDRLELITTARRLGVADRCDFQVNVDHAKAMALIAGASVFVLPSRQESFGIVLLEAGVLATPVVASWVDGIREVLPSQEFAALVPPNDPNALAAAIVSVIRNPEGAAIRARCFQERIRSHFLWPMAVSRYATLANTDGF